MHFHRLSLLSSVSMPRKIGGIALFLLLNIVLVCQVQSTQPEGWGRVNMAGAIIETACAIDTRSRDQTINMGSLPASQIVRDGKSGIRPFSIQLVNCILAREDKWLPDWQYFQITFEGFDDAGLFGVEGEAKGIALQITDSYGNIAIPGTPLPVGDIAAKEMRLNYSLRLVSNHQSLRVGQYSSTVKFKMDYY
ncbi:PAP fimbrial minor pilin protein precursor [Serratia fonticola]|nr:PAP fimbrial minor pilin protein precursor [Serratia fonticola]CAI1193587.1 PAP fimbrial minor pilin protein precursor [Serratia fonticola]CAI1965806.1 PAP fimbrial minor pilin protein precursor [Serratia fonticola]CAI2002333.1 PAP fimbrial minor pilin protein precursor [Serratia fonticola]